MILNIFQTLFGICIFGASVTAMAFTSALGGMSSNPKPEDYQSLFAVGLCFFGAGLVVGAGYILLPWIQSYTLARILMVAVYASAALTIGVFIYVWISPIQFLKSPSDVETAVTLCSISLVASIFGHGLIWLIAPTRI